MTSQAIAFPDPQRRWVDPSLVFFAALAASVTLPVAAFTAFIAIVTLWYVLFAPGQTIALALKLALPFLFMGGYALLLAGSNDRYEMFKDVWYLLKLCLCLALGLMIGVRTRRIETLYRATTLFALLDAGWAVAFWGLRQAFDIEVQDEEAATSISLICIVAIPIMLEQLRRGESAWRIPCVMALALIFAAVLLSNSRTNILATIIMIAAWAGMFAGIGRATKGAAVLAALVGLVYLLLPDYSPGDFSLLAKFRRSVEEVALTDAYDPQAMIWNWRGFEAYNAQLMFDGSSFIHKLLGSGLGATVNLGRTIEIGQDMAFQFLPTLHNGFYFLLIKFGIVGIIIYVLAVLSWMKWGRRGIEIDPTALEERLLRGLVVLVLVATSVITGLFNREVFHGPTLLIGALIGYGMVRYLLPRRAQALAHRHAPALA